MACEVGGSLFSNCKVGSSTCQKTFGILTLKLEALMDLPESKTGPVSLQWCTNGSKQANSNSMKIASEVKNISWCTPGACVARRWSQFTHVTEREVRLISGDHHHHPQMMQISTANVNSWDKPAPIVLKQTPAGTLIILVATKLQILNWFQLSSVTWKQAICN